MYIGKLIFSQVMDFIPMHTFRRCVTRYRGNSNGKSFTCLDQFPGVFKGLLKLSWRLFGHQA